MTECGCWLCGGEDIAERDDHDRNLVWHVQEHGWSVVAVTDDRDLPAWAYTVGMWHTMRTPEICMFGLRIRDMHSWLNQIGAQIRDGRPLTAGEPRTGVLDGHPLFPQQVHESWFPDLFGLTMDFYRRPALPMLQLIWPDRDGKWETESQPHLWLPKDDHPPSPWTRTAELLDSPFPDTEIDSLVFSSKRVISGEVPIVGVVHNHDGAWQFLDGEVITSLDDLGMVHLRHLIADHPHIRDFADLPRGHLAWHEADGNWSRSPCDDE